MCSQALVNVQGDGEDALGWGSPCLVVKPICLVVKYSLLQITLWGSQYVSIPQDKEFQLNS